MSVRDSIAAGMMEGVIKMLPTDYEIQNSVSQFICDQIDKILEESPLSNVIKAQIAGKANDDPNDVLEHLIALHNSGAIVGFHNDIGDFVRELNEAESEPDDDPNPE